MKFRILVLSAVLVGAASSVAVAKPWPPKPGPWGIVRDGKKCTWAEFRPTGRGKETIRTCTRWEPVRAFDRNLNKGRSVSK